MIADSPEDFAVQGETGIDLVLRIADEGQRRARFRCIATYDPASGTLHDHEPDAGRDPDRLRALAEGLAGDALLAQSFALCDPTAWPRAATAGGDPLRLFLYHEFFRAWQVADMAAERLLRRIGADPAALPLEPGKVAQAVQPLFDFNRLALGCRAAALIEPVLAARLASPGWREPKGSASGYALRMLGDLCLRAGDAGQALACFETALTAGDNPFRRRKAIEAAHAADNSAARDTHLAAYAGKWPLPDDLAALPSAPRGAP